MSRLSDAMETLWSKAADRLTDEELAQIAGCCDQGGTAVSLVEYLQESLEFMACLSMNDSTKDPDADPLPATLFFVAHCLNAVEGAMYISSCAKHRLANPACYRPAKKA